MGDGHARVTLNADTELDYSTAKVIHDLTVRVLKRSRY